MSSPAPRARPGLVAALLLTLTLAGLALPSSACVTASRFPTAAQAWRSGQRDRALTLARAEYDRFREANALTSDSVDLALADLTDALRTTPVAFADDAPPTPPERLDDAVAPETPLTSDDEAALEAGAPALLRSSSDLALRKDLGASGALRVLRATRAVGTLGLDRFGVELLAIVWRRDPFVEDHPLIAGRPVALRSIVVKRSALTALEALTRTPPRKPPTPPLAPLPGAPAQPR